MKDISLSDVYISKEVITKMIGKAKGLYGIYPCLGFLIGKRHTLPSGFVQDVTVLDVEIPKQKATMDFAEIDPVETIMFLQTMKKNNKLDEFLGYALYKGTHILQFETDLNNSLENIRSVVNNNVIGFMFNTLSECNLVLRDQYKTTPYWFNKPYQSRERV